MRAEVLAIRRSVALSRHDEIGVYRFDADAGLARLDPRVATNLELRESQFRQALALDDAGRPTLDLLIGVFRGSAWALAHGPDQAWLGTREDVVVLGLDGPFAWELLGAWDTPTAIGLPYLSAYTPRDGLLVLRAGKTGEYGYLLLVPRAEADAVWADLQRRVEAMEGRVVGIEALRHCSFENWVFDIDHPGFAGLDALELQLTWRLDLHKQAQGLDAIRAHRESGLRRRITAIDAINTMDPVPPGSEVQLEGRRVGHVLASAPRLTAEGGACVVAILDAPAAHAGLEGTIAGAPCRTRSAPFVLNRSLFVNPQRHAWATRHEVELPAGLLWPDPTRW